MCYNRRMKHANRKGTVLVTGGTRRLGKSIADALRADGWNVLVSSHRDVDGADIRADLSLPEGPARLYAEALAVAPDLCAIVNNAALFRGDDATMEALNLIAPRKLTMLLAGREGAGLCSVVNILDSKVLGPASDHDTPYERTKRGLLADTRRFAAMFAQSLRVNAVAPGVIDTPFHKKVSTPEKMAAWAANNPLKRNGEPIHIALAIKMLTENSFINGEVIDVNGGQTMH